MSDTATDPTVCTECGGTKLSWGIGCENRGGCVDGRIRMSEVRGIFTLGCDECSETLLVVSSDEIAERLNKLRGAND